DHNRQLRRLVFFFFSSRRRHTRWPRDWSSDVCSSDLSAATFCSAFRVPRSAFIVIGVMLPATMTAQTWPVHSMDRPRPPVVDPGPERPPVPPPSDAIVLFDGRDLSQWQSQDGTPAKWL